MNDDIAQADKGDARKTALLVLIVLALFGFFFAAFPAREGLHSFSMEDPAGQMDITQVVLAPAGAWTDDAGRTFNAGYTDSAYWVKAQLPGWSGGERLLVINFPLIEHITLYRQPRQGGLTSRIDMGAAHPFGERLVTSESYVIPLGSNDSEATLMLRVKTRSSMQVPLELMTVDEFNSHQRFITLFHGAYLGVVAAMFLYNILLYATTREKAYVWYLGWMVCMALFVLTVNGLAFQWFWPNMPSLNFTTLPMSLALAIACASGFFVFFLRERGQTMPGDGWIRAIGLMCLGVAVVSLWVPYRLGIIAAISMAMLMVSSAVVVASQRACRGQSSAMYYLMAFSFVITGGIVLALNKFGVIPRTFVTEYAAELGSAIEMVVLSFVIIARFNSQRRLREAAQATLILNQQLRTVELETRVTERTAELKAANDKLLALSQVDALTGVFNRRYLDDKLRQEVRRVDRARSSIAVLMIDVDYFKRLNDTYGHQTGDICLQAVASALMAGCQRPGDLVARYGGEEFTVLAPDINAAGAETLAGNLLQRIASLDISAGADTLKVTVSIGLCWQQSNGSLSGEAMLAAADKALYRAKASGRNQVATAC